jgi:sugar/nucleoside kinase (ribokinase family)
VIDISGRVADTGRAPVGVFVGLSTLDVVHQVDATPAVNQKVTARAQAIAGGGPATNAAVTFSALGGETVLVTALGLGAVAQLIRADLHACRIRLIDLAPEQVDRVAVSSITVLRRTAERSVVSVDAGMSEVADVPDLSSVLAGADVVLVDGHHPALAEAATRAAAAASIPLVIDAGRWKPVLGRVIPEAQTVICSAEFRHAGTDDSDSSARALVRLGVPTVMVTHGADPVRWWHGDQSGSVKPPAVRAVDTSGAGDVFHGAYCYFAAQTGHTDIIGPISAACEIASIKCRYLGTRSWLRHLPDPTTIVTASGEETHHQT